MSELLRRSAKFYAVGGAGIGVQLTALWLLRGQAGLSILPATAIAVEAAILHNFVWHERWTWSDRPAAVAERWRRLVRFHLSNGLLSLAGNLVLMQTLTAWFGMHYMAANGIAITACAAANFLLSEHFVFRQPA